jgi:hypothetical protein
MSERSNAVDVGANVGSCEMLGAKEGTGVKVGGIEGVCDGKNDIVGTDVGSGLGTSVNTQTT